MSITVDEIADAATADTWPVMNQLRPHLDLTTYTAMVSRMRRTDGFRVAAARTDGFISGVAGFRVIEMLYCGRILVVDDLVTDADGRSAGVGRTLIDWLDAEAARLDCVQIHLVVRDVTTRRR